MKLKLATIQEVLWYLFLFTIPFQRRLVFFQKDWYFNEWRAMFLYGTDILLVVLLCFWLTTQADQKVHLKRSDYTLLVFFAAAILSVKNSLVPAISAYQVLKLLELIFLYLYVRLYAVRHFSWVKSGIVIVASGLVQALVAIAQFLIQHDLGLRALGEGLLRPEMRGVAVFLNLAGEKIMRAYGTTPHPNVLAIYLLTAMLVLYGLYFFGQEKRRLTSELAFLATYAVLLFAFLMTFSRTTIFAWVMALLALAVAIFWRGRLKEKVNFRCLAMATLILSAIFAMVFWQEVAARVLISSQEEAVTLRLYYNGQALRAGWGSSNGYNWLAWLDPVWQVNWLGVGIGGFVSWLMKTQPHLPSFVYQPVHNMYLLIYSEMGVWGIGAFLTFLAIIVNTYRQKLGLGNLAGWLKFLPLAMFLFIGLFDHLFWTLQQGQLLLWIAIAILGHESV